MKAWVNGQLVTSEDASISIFDRGFLYGDGLFETMLYRSGKIVAMTAHYERLSGSLNDLSIPLPLTESDLKSAIHALLKAQDLTKQEAVVRVTVTRGTSYTRGLLIDEKLTPNVVMTAQAHIPKPFAPLKVCTSSYHKNENSPLSHLKSLDYLEHILARQEAYEKNVDDALILNLKGHVSELTTANVYMVKNNSIYTPQLTDGVLPGVTRQIIKDICVKEQIPFLEKTFDPGMLKSADETFMSNSVAGILPIGQIDDKVIAGRQIGPLTQRLYDAYQALTA